MGIETFVSLVCWTSQQMMHKLAFIVIKGKERKQAKNVLFSTCLNILKLTWNARYSTFRRFNNLIKLFNSFINENKDIWDDELKKEITECCEITVEHEDAFIDLCFEMGEIEGMTPEDVKQYIRFIGDRRLQQLNLDPIYGVEKNPLPWMDEMLNGAEHTNFFENRATEYSKASTQGSWEDVFAEETFAPKHVTADGKVVRTDSIKAVE